jgi:hypothetical protein
MNSRSLNFHHSVPISRWLKITNRDSLRRTSWLIGRKLDASQDHSLIYSSIDSTEAPITLVKRGHVSIQELEQECAN